MSSNMSTSNANSTVATSAIKRQMMLTIEIWSICLLIFGFIGHTLNMYVFTRPKLIRNSCVRYFLASTLSGYLIICCIIPLRMLQITYDIDVFGYSLSLCRILSYMFVCFRILPSWFIAFASIDRFLCSSPSVKLRRWSNIHVANCTIIIIIVCIALAYIHLPFAYTIVSTEPNCVFVSSFYQGFYAIWNLILWGWIPTMCIFIFGLLIIRHIHQGRRRVLPQSLYQRTQKKHDRQLIKMLLIQSFVLASTTTTLSIGILYIAITNSLSIKNGVERAKDAYLQSVLNYIGITAPCMSFYIFTLSSQLFRRELVNLFYRRQTV